MGTFSSHHPIPPRRRNPATRWFRRATAVLAVVVVLALAVLPFAAWEGTTGTPTCTVESKDRTQKAEGGSEMRVYTNCGVFSVGDDTWQRQWNSADTFGQLEAGHTYQLHTVGWRNGWLSQFPNIIYATEVAR